MIGKGRPPKNPSELAANSKRVKHFTETFTEFAPQPLLENLLDRVNPLTGIAWTRASLLLWSQLSNFPTTKNLLPAQWSSLVHAFTLDDALITGDQKMAVEARMRMPKYGIDPDDLMRMRVVVSNSENQIVKAPTMTPQRKARLPKLVNGDIR